MSGTTTTTDRVPADSPVIAERCDGCSARAAYEVVLASGRHLYLCGHHTKRNLDQLTAQDAQVQELRL